MAGLNPENAATRAGRVEAWAITAGAEARVIDAAVTIVSERNLKRYGKVGVDWIEDKLKRAR